MNFWLGLLVINFVCFLPMYMLNIKRQPNPFAFLFEKRFSNQNKLKLLYTKLHFTDPFRINVDFTIGLLLLLAIGNHTLVFYLGTLLLWLSLSYIIYISVMLYIFDRPPSFLSDWLLIKAGLVIAKKHRLVILVASISLLLFLAYISKSAVAWIQTLSVNNTITYLAVAILLSLPTLFHWKSYDYGNFQERTAYSALLHALRNHLLGKRFGALLNQDSTFFRNNNHFSEVSLSDKPNFLFICIESYGAVSHRDPVIFNEIKETLDSYQQKFQKLGFQLASNYSTSPILSGGSWLSYSTFMYGTRIDNLQLYDGLFQVSDGFADYESTFHLLKRNGYTNFLLCPMGGVNNQDVDWKSINRCFQSDVNIDWSMIDYAGEKFPFFNQKHTYCPPDQYSLHKGYDIAKNTTQDPFSLFFCTMNSHIPWNSPAEIAADWQQLNDTEFNSVKTTDSPQSMSSKYVESIRYQLEFILDFIEKNSQDNIVITLFGDHQPPLLTNGSAGLDTPIHVISKSPDFINSYIEQGFTNGFDLSKHNNKIKHEGFMSLFARACNQAFGQDTSFTLPLLPDGVSLFDVKDNHP